MSIKGTGYGSRVVSGTSARQVLPDYRVLIEIPLAVKGTQGMTAVSAILLGFERARDIHLFAHRAGLHILPGQMGTMPVGCHSGRSFEEKLIDVRNNSSIKIASCVP